MNEAPTTRKPDSLPQDILDFLAEFARAVQRFGMYPTGHPARGTTAKQVTDLLAVLISARGILQLNIGRDRFTVSGTETDPDNTLLTAFAARLYEHQLVGITFNQGIEEAEISELLSAVSIRVGKMGEPLGASPPEQLDRWPHIKLEPASYDSLALSKGRSETGEAGTPGPGTGIAIGMEGEGQGPVAGLDTMTAAGEDAQISSPFDTASGQLDQAGVGQDLTEAAIELGGIDDLDPETVRQRISRLILKLDPKALHTLTEALPDDMHKGGLENAISNAVSQFVRTAGADTGSEHSASMLKLLTKLGMRGEAPKETDDSVTPEVLSELVERLSRQWELEEPTPAEYRKQLDSLSKDAPILATEPTWLGEPKAERVVQMSLELNESGPIVEQSVQSMIENGELSRVLELFASAPKDSTSVGSLWRIVAGPETVKQLIESDPPDFVNLDRLLPRLESDSADPMLDTLTESDSSATRKGLIERLVKMGAKVGPAVVERLNNERGDIRRIMLVILKYLPSLPEDFSPESYWADPVRGVRLEAMKLALLKSPEPESIISRALRDSDQQIIELGLSAAVTNCPPSIIPDIIPIVLNAGAASTLRLAGIRALASTESEEALNALLELTWIRKWVVLRKLAPKSSEMLEALAVLARGWNDNPKVHSILEAAAKNKDAQIRAVARSRERT